MLDKIVTDGEAPVLELREKWTTSSLPLLLSPLWPWLLVPVKIQCMSQIESFNNLTVCKQRTDVR